MHGSWPTRDTATGPVVRARMDSRGAACREGVTCASASPDTGQRGGLAARAAGREAQGRGGRWRAFRPVFISMSVLSTRGAARAGASRSRVRRPAATAAFSAIVSTVLAHAAPAVAQTPDGSGAQTIVVTASRTPQPLSAVLADVSVVDRAAIERSGAVGVADVLARLPGIELARSGGVAGTTSLFLRGAEARHTAVYIDGVRIDSQASGGALWEQIPLEQIDRIEVLRGPAAAVYGSDAVGGVVQLFTRRGRAGAPRPTAAVTVGTHGTRVASAGLSGGAGGVDYALSASHGRSDGFDARTDAVAHNLDRDGWRRRALQARLGWQFAEGQRVHAAVLASRLRAAYDGFGSVDDVAHHGLDSTSLGWQGRWSDSASTRLDIGRSHSTYETQPSYYRTETTLTTTTLLHEQRVAQGQLVTAALERREDELHNPATTFAAELRDRRHQDAVALGWRADVGAHGVQLHLRHDDDSAFGGHGTGSLAWGWQFTPQWWISASAASSFRAPTLYQRYSPYGNAALVPERGRNVELGLRWATPDTQASLHAWRNRVSELINFGPPGPCADAFGCFVNVGRAELGGVTLAGRTRMAGVALHGSLAWHDPRNADTGRVLPRRAKRLATFGAETALAGWTLGAEVQGTGARWENVANTQRLGGYGLVNVYASVGLPAGLALELRVDNAGDKRYETARAFATGGRQAQATLRWTMP
jgi:vitamin B12 transporter